MKHISYTDLIVLASGKDCITHHNRTASKLGLQKEKIPNNPPKVPHTIENHQDYERINRTIQEFKNNAS